MAHTTNGVIMGHQQDASQFCPFARLSEFDLTPRGDIMGILHILMNIVPEIIVAHVRMCGTRFQ